MAEVDKRQLATDRGLTWGGNVVHQEPTLTAPPPENVVLTSRSPCRLVPARQEVGFWYVTVDDAVVLFPTTKEQALDGMARIQEWREAVWAEDDAKEAPNPNGPYSPGDKITLAGSSGIGASIRVMESDNAARVADLTDVAEGQ